MAPRTEEQFERIREERKKLIMDTALELFANDGFYSTSISKIASKAGISKGLLYNYFDSKEELIKEIAYKGFDQLFSTFDQNKDGILTQEEFEYFINEMFDMIEKNIHYWRLYFTLILQPPVLNIIMDKVHETYTYFFNMMENYYKQKNIDNPRIKAMMFGGLIDGIGFHYMIEPENYPLEKVKHEIIETFK
ncbi:MAG: TetR/AcrR family transcriptional regulator [Bacteroidales bacterium]|nr:TetR/AcrR family transcriptional regulator [Bacteroidales bacterium]